MIAGRQPTPEDIEQGACEEGTDGDAQVLLAAVLLTPAGEYRLVSWQQYIEEGGARIQLVRTGPVTVTRGVRVEIDGTSVPYDTDDNVAFASAHAVFAMFRAVEWHDAPRVSCMHHWRVPLPSCN